MCYKNIPALNAMNLCKFAGNINNQMQYYDKWSFHDINIVQMDPKLFTLTMIQMYLQSDHSTFILY